MCKEDCTGLDTQRLSLVPRDKHLIRLARLIGGHFYYEFIMHLELPLIEWTDIEDDKRYPDGLTKRFVGLCQWRTNKLGNNVSATFKDLSKALTDIGYSEHNLCQVFRERLSVVLSLDNPKLQEIPEDNVLMELSRNIGHHTLQLGVELGLDMTSIEETVTRYDKDMFAQTYDILHKWKCNSQFKRNVRTLMFALQYVDLRGFIFLKEQYVESE